MRISLLIILLSLPLVAAQVDLFSAIASLEDGTVKHHVILRFSEPVQEFHWYLPEVRDLEVKSEFPADCQIRQGVSCRLQDEANKTITLDFRTPQNSWEEEGAKTVRIDYTFPLRISKVIVLVKLPEQGVLAEEPVNRSFLPHDGDIMTDGKHIIVYWERDGVKAGEGMVFSVSYSLPERPWEFYWIILLLPIPVLLAFYWIRRMRRQILTEVLLPEERRIVEILQQNRGKMLQKQLVRQTDFSKAKVSRILKSLRKKGLVRIEPVSGRENRVLLRYEKGREEKDSKGES